MRKFLTDARTRRAFVLSGGAVLAVAGTASRVHAQQDKLIPVSLGYPVPNIPWAAFQLGQDTGIFKKYGLSLTLRSLGTATTVNAALIGGSVDFGVASSIAFLAAREKGIPFRSLLVYARRLSYSVVASPQFAQSRHISKDSSIAEIVKGLANARVAYTTPQDRTPSEDLLQSFGADPKSLSFVTVSGLPAAMTALQQGQIDWFLNAPPAVYQAEATGAAVILLAPTQVPQWDMPISGVLLANSERLAGREDVTRRTVQALNESVQYAVAHPEEVLAPARAMFPNVSDDILRKSFTAFGWRPDGVQTAADWKTTFDYVAKLGLVDPKLQIVEGSDWTNQYLASPR
jgi:NitT/TauT family transport system substrate-binding protein